MRGVNISEQFTGWIKLLFGNASITIVLELNEGSDKIVHSLLIFFLIVGEVLMHTIKKAFAEGRSGD
jgi:hypothetical protein